MEAGISSSSVGDGAGGWTITFQRPDYRNLPDYTFSETISKSLCPPTAKSSPSSPSRSRPTQARWQRQSNTVPAPAAMVRRIRVRAQWTAQDTNKPDKSGVAGNPKTQGQGQEPAEDMGPMPPPGQTTVEFENENEPPLRRTPSDFNPNVPIDQLLPSNSRFRRELGSDNNGSSNNGDDGHTATTREQRESGNDNGASSSNDQSSDDDDDDDNNSSSDGEAVASSDSEEGGSSTTKRPATRRALAIPKAASGKRRRIALRPVPGVGLLFPQPQLRPEIPLGG